MTIATEFPTYATILAQVEMETDTQDEVFVQDDELMGYANEAIDEAEKIVMGLHEDYFLARDTLTLVNGTEEYSLPADIYAHKIRAMVYRNGSRVFVVKRERDWKKFIHYEINFAGGSSSSAEYKYFIINESAGTPKVLLGPTPAEAGSYLKAWYIRQANRFTTSSDVLDIPEAKNFVIQYMKKKIYEKEGHPNLATAIAELAVEKESLEGVLATMVPDADNEIEMDLSHYEEMN